ncbi:hypothetical protein ACSBR1_019501 [Camellia fascicularis]
MISTSAPHRIESSLASLKGPDHRFEKVTWRLLSFSILVMVIFWRPLLFLCMARVNTNTRKRMKLGKFCLDSLGSPTNTMKQTSPTSHGEKEQRPPKDHMTKMENESNLEVTFSKRRSGLFKKASEFSIPCGAEVGIIVFSSGKKAYSFGQTTVDMIIDRFLSRDSEQWDPPAGGGHKSACVRDLNLQLTHVQALLGLEKQRGTALDQLKMATGQGEHHWWEGQAEEMNLG